LYASPRLWRGGTRGGGGIRRKRLPHPPPSLRLLLHRHVAQVKKEISIMKMVRNSHVVQLKEVLASRTKIFIVLELITGGELFDKVLSYCSWAKGGGVKEKERMCLSVWFWCCRVFDIMCVVCIPFNC
jgi:serine/threonine protein kinase